MMMRSQSHRTGTYYGSFAFISVILACFTGFFTEKAIDGSGEAVLVTFALGALYTALSVFSYSVLQGKGPLAHGVYYTLQLVLVTTMLFVSPIRGFFGIIVLPLGAQAIFDLRPWRAGLINAYLFALTIAVWAIPFGWRGAWEAFLSYSTGFAFTIIFTIITRQALNARNREEKLREEVEAANLQLRDYAAQASDLATTRERNRVAREIHDGVGHYLTVIKTQLDAASALLPSQPEKAAASVHKAAKLAGEALQDVRQSVGALRTDAARPPLPDALRELAAQGDPTPTFAVEGTPRPLPPAVEHALFRAAQEGLTNIRKHAHATSALLLLDFRAAQKIRLELSDNGLGTKTAPATTGFGLVGMRERIELLGGRVDSGNRLDGGFALTVEVPA